MLPKCINDIFLKISVALQFLVVAEKEWAAAKATEDPSALVDIVHCTHSDDVGGATHAMAKINMRKSFNPLEHGTFRSISEFKKVINTLVRYMRGINISEMDGETSAI